MAHEDTARDTACFALGHECPGNTGSHDHSEHTQLCNDLTTAITSALQAAAAEATLGESLRDRAADELSPQERSSPFGSASLSQAERDAAYFQDINVRLEASLRSKEALALRLRSERNQLRFIIGWLMEWEWPTPFERDDFQAVMMDANLMDREEPTILFGQAKKIAAVHHNQWLLKAMDLQNELALHYRERDRNPEGGDFLGSVEDESPVCEANSPNSAIRSNDHG